MVVKAHFNCFSRPCLVLLALIPWLWAPSLEIITSNYKLLNIVGMRFFDFFFPFLYNCLPRKAYLKSHLPSGNLCGPALRCIQERRR